MSSEPTTQEAEEVEGHEHKQIVFCWNEDEPEDVITYGPFEDDKWAEAWIKQHNNDPYFGTEQEQEDRMVDEDHWCPNGAYSHTLQGMWVPGFDPTTLPLQE